MIDVSNYYYRFPDILEDRLDFVYYHPVFGKVISIKNNFKYPVHRIGEYFIGKWTGENLEIKDLKEKKYLYVKVENVVDNKITITENSEFLSDDELHRISTSIPKSGSILVTRVASFGRCAVVDRDFIGAISDNILCFELNDDVESHFISRFINSTLGQTQILQSVAGMGRGVLTYDRIGNLYIGIPALKGEQKKILEAVDSIESQANDLENEVNTIIAKAEDIFLNSVGICLPIDVEKINYYIDSMNVDRLDFDFNNPKYDIVEKLIFNSHIKFVELSEVVDFLQESRNPMECPEKEFLYADIGNINKRWGILNPVKMYGKDAESSRMRRVMHVGAILVSTTRPTRNAIAIVPEDLDNQICSTGLAVLKCKGNMNNKFLFYALRTQLTNLQFERYCSGSGYPAINQEVDLPKIKVPMPSTIKEQLKVVIEVENILKKAKEKESEAISKKREVKDTFERLILKETSVN